MKFTKMHGCGNDYLYFDCTKQQLPNATEAAIRLSDRHFGVGGDGIILIKPSDVADFYMEMYNADGSQGKMCGNGIRCVAKFVYDYHLTDKTTITVETLSGIKTLELMVEDGVVSQVTVNMGRPAMEPEQVPTTLGHVVQEYPVEVDGTTYRLTAISMGNPHAVIRVDETATFPVQEAGVPLESHEMFPDRANIEFVQVLNRGEVNMRVWERGSGETLACGTGACATAFACYKNGWTDKEVTVHLLGGDLRIRYDEAEDTVYMTGPATIVFEGDVEV